MCKCKINSRKKEEGAQGGGEDEEEVVVVNAQVEVDAIFGLSKPREDTPAPKTVK